MLLVANSTPIVDLLSKLNSFRVNRESKLDFPTPESPISTTLNRKSYSSSLVAILHERERERKRERERERERNRDRRQIKERQRWIDMVRDTERERR